MSWIGIMWRRLWQWLKRFWQRLFHWRRSSQGSLGSPRLSRLGELMGGPLEQVIREIAGSAGEQEMASVNTEERSEVEELIRQLYQAYEAGDLEAYIQQVIS